MISASISSSDLWIISIYLVWTSPGITLAMTEWYHSSSNLKIPTLVSPLRSLIYHPLNSLKKLLFTCWRTSTSLRISDISNAPITTLAKSSKKLSYLYYKRTKRWYSYRSREIGFLLQAWKAWSELSTVIWRNMRINSRREWRVKFTT